MQNVGSDVSFPKSVLWHMQRYDYPNMQRLSHYPSSFAQQKSSSKYVTIR